MLQKLQHYKHDLKDANQACEKEGSDRNKSALDAHSLRTNTELNQAMNELESYLQNMHGNTVQWQVADKAKTELENWLRVKQVEVRELMDRPAKLHHDAAVLEISHLEVRFCSHLFQ